MRAISKFFENRTIRFAGILAGAVVAAFALPVIGAEAAVSDTASKSYTNPETDYSAFIFDGADYLTAAEEVNLLEDMKGITAYTNAIYVTDENNVHYTMSYSENLAEQYAHSLFGEYDNVIVYVCDNENDYIYSQGKVQKTITSSKAYSITDNIYTYSMDEKYYKAAHEAFRECERLLQGKAIAEPMKYICNAFIALFLGFIICYLYVSKKSSLKYANYDDIVEGAICYAECSGTSVNFVNTTRTYSPRSSSSGGHHGGGHHGGGHHGGGHSGGGHSH